MVEFTVKKASGGGGGGTQIYGVGIDQALQAQNVSLEQLKLLRDQARMVLTTQGNLSDSLARLEAEIAKREAG
jgi:hypothetical protein